MSQPRTALHPSAAALLYWRGVQLYTVLPKRETDAARWLDDAVGALGGSNRAEIRQQLTTLHGPAGALKQAKGGPGVAQDEVFDLQNRRMMPSP